MSEFLKVGGPLPISIGRCADLYHDVRELRLAMEKEVAEIQARETEVREHIIANLSKSEDTGAAGLRFRAQRVDKRKFRFAGTSEELPAGGWPGFTAWMSKHGRFDMIQKRLADKAVGDFYAEEKRLPPGLETLLVPDLSVTKI